LSVLKSSGTLYISAMEMSWASLVTMKTMCRLMTISTPWDIVRRSQQRRMRSVMITHQRAVVRTSQTTVLLHHTRDPSHTPPSPPPHLPAAPIRHYLLTLQLRNTQTAFLMEICCQSLCWLRRGIASRPVLWTLYRHLHSTSMTMRIYPLISVIPQRQMMK
ncbi:hypothetical protein M9458_036943, partial [Cirrhinus mrigala]